MWKTCKLVASISGGFVFFLGLVLESSVEIVRDGILALLRR